jgi:hypothetical protein
MLIINTQMPFLLLEFANTKEKMNQFNYENKAVRVEMRNNNSNNENDDDKEFSLPVVNTTLTTGSIFSPTELNLGALNPPICLILCSYLMWPHIFFSMGIVMLL